MIYKKGMVVELHSLKNGTNHNNKRGFVFKATNDRVIVVMDGDIHVKVKHSNLYPVHCLGIPQEYWLRDTEASEEEMLDQLRHMSKNSSAFEHIVCKNEKGVSGFLINKQFFKIALKKIQDVNMEPLLRVYGMNKSSKNTNIVFDYCCANVVEDMSLPWFVDFYSDKVKELAA